MPSWNDDEGWDDRDEPPRGPRRASADADMDEDEAAPTEPVPMGPELDALGESHDAALLGSTVCGVVKPSRRRVAERTP